MAGTVQLSVRVEPKLKKQTERAARRRGKTIQEAVAESLRQWLEREEPETPPAE